MLTSPKVPVIVTVMDWLTAEVTALNPVVCAPSETVTAEGTANAELLLFKRTTVGVVADALKYTEHPFVCGPVRDCVPHETWASSAAVVEPEAPLGELLDL